LKKLRYIGGRGSHLPNPASTPEKTVDAPVQHPARFTMDQLIILLFFLLSIKIAMD